MAITSVEGVRQGLIPPLNIWDSNSTGAATFYGFSGQPIITGINGQALTSPQSTWTSQIFKNTSYTNPEVGKSTYISGCMSLISKNATVYGNSFAHAIIIADFLWLTSGLAFSTGPQSITFPTLPSRDINGENLGEGVIPMFFVSPPTALGADPVSIAITYTNSKGISGRSSTTTDTVSILECSAVMLPLQSGDTGVRSIQTIEFGANPVSGTPVIALIRPLIITGACFGTKTKNGIDNLLLTKIFDNSVLAPIINRNSSSFSLSCILQLTQG